MNRLTPGTAIGVYQVEEVLGEGGMGTVYRARDSKLHRAVAIKFLSNEVADASARRRFQREAQLASSLNHPHILTVHDIGELDSRQYLVTELADAGCTVPEIAAITGHSIKDAQTILDTYLVATRQQAATAMRKLEGKR